MTSPNFPVRPPRRFFLLAAFWLLSLLPGQAGQPPTGADRTITLDEDSPYEFRVTDYGFADAGDVPPDDFTGIRLTTLPTAGTLLLDGRAVAQNDFVSMKPVPGIVWTPRGLNRNWTGLAVSANGMTMAALGLEQWGAYIYVSIDGGVSWTARRGLDGWSDIACSADGRKIIASDYLGQLHLSSDAGLSWAARESNRAWTKVGSSADGTILYAAAEGFYRSLDSGLTWNHLPGAPAGRVFTNSGDGIRLSTVGFDGSLYSSQDSGVTWQVRGSLPGSTLFLASSADGTRLVASGYLFSGSYTGYLSTSDNSGDTWTVRQSTAKWGPVASSSDGRILAAAVEGGQIHISMDYGATWTPRGEGRLWHVVACSADGSKFLAGAEDAMLFTSDPTVPMLTYHPPRDHNGSPYTSFTFQVEDSGVAPTNLALGPNAVTLNVTAINDAPTIIGSLADSFAPVGSSLLWVLPPDRFADVDAGSVFTYSATLPGGGALPAWLAFDPLTLTFSGTPLEQDRGDLDLQITATDNGVPPLSASIRFRLTSGSDAPAGTDRVRELDEDVPYAFTAADFGFTDPGDEPPDEFTGVRIATLPAAGTLTVEGVQLMAGDYVSVSAEARQKWTAGGIERNFVSLTSSADGIRLAAADNSALYFSSDSGVTWTSRQSGRNWDCIASSGDGMKLVAGVYNGSLYTSSDAGVTWQARDSDRPWQAVASSLDGTKLVAGTNAGPLYTSVDSGVTWTPRSTHNNWRSVASSHDGTQLIAAAGGGMLYTSTDSGITWTPREQSRVWYAVASSSDGSRLAAVDGTAIYVSSDAGISWQVMQSGSAWYDIASSADGTRLVAVAYEGRIHTSRDGGNRWIPHERSRPWRCVASSSDGNKLAAAGQNVRVHTSTAAVPQLLFTPALHEFGSPYASFTFQVEDNGTGGPVRDPLANHFTWHVRPVNDRPRVGFPIPDRTATERLPFSSQFNTVYFTDADPDTVFTFSAQRAGGFPLPAWLSFDPANRAFTGTPGVMDTGILLVEVTATDNGEPPLAVSDIFEIAVANVDDPPSGTDGMASMLPGAPYTFAPADFGFSDPDDFPPNLFSRVKITTLPAAGILTANGVTATAGTMVRMVASAPGVAWRFRESNRNWGSIASSADGIKLVAAAGGVSTSGRIYTSIDAGATWTARESVRNWYAVASSWDGVNLVAAAHSGQLYTSTDSGITWTPRATLRSWRAVASSADGTKLVAGEYGGRLYTSVDSGLTWTARESSRLWQALASSSDGTHLAAVAALGKIYLSRDSGVTWTPSGPELLWRFIASSAEGTKLAAVVQDGRIYTSADAGLSWIPRESVRTWYSITSSADGTRLAAVAQNGRIYISDDSGVSWRAREASRSWRCITTSADGSRLAAAVNGGQIFTSEILPAETLVFTPGPQGDGNPYASFGFQVEDDASPPAANLDPTSNLFYLNVGGPHPFRIWALQHSLSPDPNAEGGANLLRFSFGMDPASGNPALTLEGGTVARRGSPVLLLPGPADQRYSALFGRRKDSGLTSVVQFSGDLTTWESNVTPPVVLADDGVIEACRVPFPATLGNGQIPQYFRVAVSMP